MANQINDGQSWFRMVNDGSEQLIVVKIAAANGSTSRMARDANDGGQQLTMVDDPKLRVMMAKLTAKNV